MFHEYAPLAAFAGLILAIAGSAAFGQRPSLLSFALVAIGAVLNVTPYL
jgi:fatty acid desaturase